MNNDEGSVLCFSIQIAPFAGVGNAFYKLIDTRISLKISKKISRRVKNLRYQIGRAHV
jgi:hypothetical protein